MHELPEVAVSQLRSNEELVRRWFDEVWNRKNVSAIDELLAPDCIAYGLPDPDAVLRGPDEFKEVHRAFCSVVPDIQIELKDVIAAGDRVAARWRATGTHSGEGLGFSPTGKRIVLDGATIAVVGDGRIREGWNMMDMGHLFSTLRGDGSRF